jgi:hypothetical protein
MKRQVRKVVVGLMLLGLSLVTMFAFHVETRDAQGQTRLAARLVGTWRVVSYVDTDPGGKVTYPYGEHPAGYFIYDPTGHLSIQIMRTPPTPAFSSGDDDKGTAAEVRAAYDGYVAYFGTYRVDEKRSVVTHVVEGSLKPGYTGTEQPRPFTLNGDKLVIEMRDSDGYFYRELRRVR